MTPPMPVDEIRLFDWKSHKAALWWLGVLYRRPAFLEQALKSLSRGRAVRTGVLLYLQSFPYVVTMVFALHAATLAAAGKPVNWYDVLQDTAFGIVAVPIRFHGELLGV